MKKNLNSQHLISIISAIESFKEKCYVGFDSEMNGLQSGTIEFLEAVEDKSILAKYQQNKVVEIIANT
jgi:hypothetical protein